MTSAWTNFAIFGDPTPPDTALSWTPVNPNSEIQEYWNISGTKPIMATSQKIKDRMVVWGEIMNK